MKAAIPVVLAVVATAATLVYLNSLDGEFVFDDIPELYVSLLFILLNVFAAIRDNADVDPSQTALSHLFESNFWGQPMGSQWSQHVSYRPFTTLTFRLNYSIHGLSTWGYHLVNLICHVIASVLVTSCAYRVFDSMNFIENTRHFAALLTGLLFATHPVHTEAVSNIVCRAELLSCIFWCLSFLVYDVACRQKSNSLHYLGIATASGLAVVSMLCKEQGIMVLPSCVVYDIFILDRFDLSSYFTPQDSGDSDPPEEKAQSSPKKGQKVRKTKPVASSNFGVPSRECLIRVGLTIAFTAVIYQWRVSLNKGDVVKNDEKTNPANHIDDVLLRYLTKNYYVFLHFWLLLVPSELCCDWSSFGVANIEGIHDPRNLGTLWMYAFLGVIVLALLFTNIMKREVRAAALFGIATMAINFVPASGLLVETGFVIAERILYLPSIGFCIAVVAFITELFRTIRPSSKKFLVALLLLTISLYSARTWLRNADWKSEESLYLTGLKVLPNNAKLHHNYARAIENGGSNADKEFHYRAAIRIYPPYASAYINLGVTLANEGRLEEAITIWKQGLGAWSRRPILGQDPVILNLNIGTGLKNMGRYREAIPYLEKCLQLSPGKPNCQQALAFVRSQLGY